VLVTGSVSVAHLTCTVCSTYCSTYCNKGHSIKTGRPVGHECRIIPPRALALERFGRYEEAIEVMQNEKRPRFVRGRKA
jgi:hypothetical protein